ncbi:MAG: AMP-binding protein [Alphaproteobacteria bacterium]|nr:AMP-binding protein [Alphaproteobacteria bacterium]
MQVPESRTAAELLDELVARQGERKFIVDGDRRYSYAAFQADVRSHAKGLLALGLKRGDRMAILLDNRAEWLTAYFAAMSIGAETVALNCWASAPELAYQLDHAKVRSLVATAEVRGRGLADLLADIHAHNAGVRLEHIICVSSEPVDETLAFSTLPELGATVSDAAWRNASNAVDPKDTACILYTSGSTATPKGVPLLHHGLVENMWRIGERQHLTPDDRLWLAVSLFWSFGCVNALFAVMTHGGTVVLQREFDAGEALALIERERCTVFYGTPNMSLALWEHPDREQHDLSSLRTGATIGTPEQVRRIAMLGATEICNVYGLTEAYGNSAVGDAHDPMDIRVGNCGRPLDDVEIRIVDPESRAPLPAGAPGEIIVRGFLTPGYLDAPERTAEAFDAEGFLLTGDLGVLDSDGYLTFRGRLKEMVKTGGINVAPAEVEAALSAHPAIEEVYVTGIPDTRLDEALAAVIVFRDGMETTDAELIAHCREQLAAYKVPRHYRFVERSDLPLTGTGKLQKNRLSEFFDPGNNVSQS